MSKIEIAAIVLSGLNLILLAMGGFLLNEGCDAFARVWDKFKFQDRATRDLNSEVADLTHMLMELRSRLYDLEARKLKKKPEAKK